MIALLLTLCIALAAEPADPAPAADSADLADLAELLKLADTLEAGGEEGLARRTRIAVADSPEATEAERGRAEAALRAMPGLPSGASPATVRLLAWHAIAGGAVLPLAVSGVDTQPRAAAQIGMVLIGSGAALGGTFAYARQVRITPARTTAMLGIEQLAALHGGAFASFVPSGRNNNFVGRYSGTGMGIGLAAGAVPALLVGQARLDDGRVVSAYSGAVWGGFIAGALKAGRVVKPSLDARADWWTITAGADLGALVGYGLGSVLHLSRDELRMANIAGLFGLASTYLFGWSTQYDILWTPPAYTLFAIGGSLLGAAGGVLIVRSFDRPARDGELALMPTFAPTPGGATAGVALRF